eukprot:200201-Prorocentrum_minimum.AAC.1
MRRRGSAERRSLTPPSSGKYYGGREMRRTKVRRGGSHLPYPRQIAERSCGPSRERTERG